MCEGGWADVGVDRWVGEGVRGRVGEVTRVDEWALTYISKQVNRYVY